MVIEGSQTLALRAMPLCVWFIGDRDENREFWKVEFHLLHMPGSVQTENLAVEFGILHNTKV